LRGGSDDDAVELVHGARVVQVRRPALSIRPSRRITQVAMNMATITNPRKLTRTAPVRVHDAIAPTRLHVLLELYRTTWWAAHRSAVDVERMLAESDLVVALVDGDSDRLVAFARVLTDFTYRAIVFDVIVATDTRGRGLGAWLMNALVEHPRLAGSRASSWSASPA
jgi:GNAT superfamily N-acetyltransferase